MHTPLIEFDPDTFILTPTGVKVSRNALMCTPQNVEMPGGKSIIMPHAIIRGDFAHISIQRYCFIGENTVIRPSYSMTETFKFIPMYIGKYTYIGNDCVVESASIGQGCTVGNNCILSQRTILKDYVTVEDNTVVPPDMVVPPFAIISGCPARIVGESPESTSTCAQIEAKNRFKMFKARSKS
mmetsp:Transcript_19813/g.28492  ORF Transcript_19813/g.28492 Transcript_19813/m.28492 type:complete len:183 (-) Transcript_19813:120-668(-)